MLRFFSKFQRSRNAVLLAFCAVLLVGLVVFYIPSTDLGGNRPAANAGEAGTVIAKVGSYEITLRELQAVMAGLAAPYARNNQLPPSLLKSLGLDKQALERLIEERVALLEADRLNLGATDREVSDEITRNPQFIDPETKRFIGAEEYRRRLALAGENLSDFERNVRWGIATGRVRDFLSSTEQVSDRDIEQTFKKDNTRVEMVYALLDLEKVRSQFKPSDEELRAYYTAHQDEFKATDPVRQVDYLFIPTEKVAATLKLTDEDLRAEYEQNKKVEKRASIIKVNVQATADEATIRAKVQELDRRVRGGGTVKPEDFADVARGNSQDPSAAKGGDIGFIKEDPNRKSAWQQRPYANSLKVGDIDGPFREGSSWYLLKVTEEREVPFEQMRPTLAAGVRNRRGYSEASKLADKAYELFTESKNIRQAAEAIAKEIGVAPETLVRSTPFFKNGDTLPGIGSNPTFEEAVAQLKEGEIGDKVGIPEGLAVPQVVAVRQAGQQLSFEEAKFQVSEKLRREREPNLAQQRAQEIVNQAKTAAEFQQLIKQAGLDVKTDTNLNTLTSPGSATGGLQALQQARNTALNLKEGDVSKTPIKFGAAYLIMAATKRTEADLSKLAAERDGVRQAILRERQNLALDTYLKSARKRYDEGGQIRIDQDRIDAFFAAAAQQ